jgi:hypothetical protein
MVVLDEPKWKRARHLDLGCYETATETGSLCQTLSLRQRVRIGYDNESLDIYHEREVSLSLVLLGPKVLWIFFAKNLCNEQWEEGGEGGAMFLQEGNTKCDKPK